MKELISKRARNITPSQTLAITAAAKKMKAEGISVISFTAGEPDFATPTYIVDAAKDALDKGFTKYTPSAGTEELRKVIAIKLEKENGLKYDYKQIIVSNGAKHSLYNAMFALVDDGDEVIIPSPYWLTYPEIVIMCGGKPVFVETSEENDYKITPELLESAITEKTKAFILNSPSNPTGTVYTSEETYALAEVLIKHNVYCISDEIYEKLYYGVKPTSIATYSDTMKSLTIVINGLSKSYAMTGWRVGYLAAERNISDVIDRVQSHMTSNINSIAQKASTAAFSRTGDVEELVKIYNSRREYMVKRINSFGKISVNNPDGSFYLFVNVSKLIGKKVNGSNILGSIDLANKLLDFGVAVIPGAPFGADDHIRLSFALSDDDIKIGLDRIEEFLSKIE